VGLDVGLDVVERGAGEGRAPTTGGGVPRLPSRVPSGGGGTSGERGAEREAEEAPSRRAAGERGRTPPLSAGRGAPLKGEERISRKESPPDQRRTNGINQPFDEGERPRARGGPAPPRLDRPRGPAGVAPPGSGAAAAARPLAGSKDSEAPPPAAEAGLEARPPPHRRQQMQPACARSSGQPYSTRRGHPN